MSPHAATFQEAIQALEFLMGWTGGWLPMRWQRDGRSCVFYHRTGVRGSGHVLAELVRSHDERHSDEIRLGLPEMRRFQNVFGATVLWCRVEGKDQLERARKFRPLPTLVIQEGASTRRLLIWGLRSWLGYFDVEDFNRRIAYRLRAVQRHGVPENLWVPAPGTCLRVGRARPVPVVTTRLTTDVYDAVAVAGRLRKPPEIDPASWGRAAA